MDESFPPFPSSLVGDIGAGTAERDGIVTSSRRAPHFIPSTAAAHRREEGYKFSRLFGSLPPTRVALQQGALGDCWLVSAMTALSERPRLIEALFPAACNPGSMEYDDDDDYNNNNKEELSALTNEGYCTCLLYFGGTPHLITVDTFLPCYPLSGPLYCKSPSGSLWAPLLEKAFAKVAGGYQNLVGGYAYEGMMDLTGRPTYHYALDDEDVRERIKEGSFWTDVIVGAVKKRWLLTCTTHGEIKRGGRWRNEDKEEDLTEDGTFNGLVKGHAYAILWAGEVGGYKLLHVRNPWGGFEWRGDWSKGSLLWTNEVRFNEVSEYCEATHHLLSFIIFPKSQVKTDIKRQYASWNGESGGGGGDEGSFWMSLGDWVRRFESVSVCMVTDGKNREWNVLRKKIVFAREDDDQRRGADQMVMEKRAVGWTASEETKRDGGGGIEGQYPLRSCVWKLHVPERTECVVALHNKDIRFQRGGVVEGDYPPVGVSILKAPEKGIGGGGGGMGMIGRGRGGYQYVGGQGVRKERQIVPEKMELEEGVYLVVPYTTMEYEDWLAGGGEGGMEEVAGSVRMACGEIFDRFDEENKGVLEGVEFGKLIDAVVGLERLNDTVERGKMSDGLGWSDGIGMLEKERWIKKMESMVRRGREGGGMKALSQCLMACGYEMDRGGCWRLVNALVGALSVHTSVECKLSEAGKNR